MSQFSGLLEQIAARLPVRPAAYLWFFILWAILLCFLSSRSADPSSQPVIAHFDKLLHFSYFFIGGGIMAAYGGLRWAMLTPEKLAVITTLLCCAIGRLDEYHQGFIPGRSGNDTGDWLADTLGGLFGSWLFIRCLMPRIVSKEAQ